LGWHYTTEYLTCYVDKMDKKAVKVKEKKKKAAKMVRSVFV